MIGLAQDGLAQDVIGSASFGVVLATCDPV